MSLRLFGLIALGGLLIAKPAAADFIAPSVSGGYAWNRPTTSGTAATFQAWDVFSFTAGPNAPQPVMGAGTGDHTVVTTGAANTYKGFGGDSTASWTTINSVGTANAFDSNAATVGPSGFTSFLTSGGNIYSFDTAVNPRITIPNNIDGVAGINTNGTTHILVQLRVQGTELDFSTVKLFDPVSGQDVFPISNTLLATLGGGTMGASTYDRLFVFQVAGNADLYQFDASAAGTSLSLDRIAVDTFWNSAIVPEPMGIGLAALASMVACRRHRARRVG